MTVNSQNPSQFVPVDTTVPEHPEVNVIGHLHQYVTNYFQQHNLAPQPGSDDAAMLEEPNNPERRQYRFVCTTTSGRKFYFFVISDKHDNVIGVAGHMELDAQNNPIVYEVPVQAVGEAQA